MSTKLLKITIVFATLLLLSVGFVYATWTKLNAAPSNSKEEGDFLITKGSSAAKIAQDLKNEGYIGNTLIFKSYVRLTRKASKIPPGSYKIPKNLTMREVVEVLLAGPKDVWVLIPEGLRREEVANLLAEGLGKDGEEREVFIDGFLEATSGSEGFLFPDTYLFSKDVSPASIAIRMREVFNKKVESLIKSIGEGGTKEGLSFNEVVTLASIIERETRRDSERALVAGILLKRLNIGMALQADATVQYAVSSAKCKVQSAKCEWWPQVLRADLKLTSPFNTYSNAGLPPSPIANPGLSSLEAAANPAETDFLYYLHDSEGIIHTAQTYSEHQENIAKYLR